MSIWPLKSNKVHLCIKGSVMGMKLGSVVMVLMMVFIAKISLETAMAEKTPDLPNDRSPASIDQSYRDHLASKH